ncbi:MAG: hypothetical protein AAGA76_09380, partial [Pseudomonadota bacterium]
MDINHLSGLFVPTVVAMFATAFVILWLFQKQKRHILGFAGVFFMFAIALILSPIMLTNITPPIVIIGNVAVISGFFLLVWSIFKREKKQGIHIPIWAITTVGITGTITTAWATAAFDSINLQIVSNTTMFSLLCLISAACLKQHAFQKSIECLIFWSIMACSVQLSVLAGTTFFFEGAIENANFKETGFWVAINLIAITSAILMALSIFVLCAFDSFTDARDEA